MQCALGDISSDVQLLVFASDGTLNPGGVRFGSTEIYHVGLFHFSLDTLCTVMDKQLHWLPTNKKQLLTCLILFNYKYFLVINFVLSSYICYCDDEAVSNNISATTRLLTPTLIACNSNTVQSQRETKHLMLTV